MQAARRRGEDQSGDDDLPLQTKEELSAAWATLRTVICGTALERVPFDRSGVPVRTQWFFDAFPVNTLADLVDLDLEDVFAVKNVGRKTVSAIIRKAVGLLEMGASVRFSQLIATLAMREEPSDRWSTLRRIVSNHQIESRPFPRSGLPARARRILDDLRLHTLGEVVGVGPEELLRGSSIGRKTLDSVLARAEALANQPQPEVGAPPSFTQIVDRLLQHSTDAERDAVRLRFLDHLTLQECGERMRLSRERIRQLERRVLTRLAERCAELTWHAASILDDGFIAASELQADDAADHAFDARLYVTLARATLLSAKGLRQLETFYGRELDVLVDDLGDSASALAGRLTDDQILQRAAELTPALLEWPGDRLIRESRKALGAAGRGGTVRLLPLLRALVREAGGEMSVAALRHRLSTAVAAVGGSRVIDDATIRTLVQRSRELCMRDAHKVGGREPESEALLAWSNRAIEFILHSLRPASLVKFLDRHRDCPLDEFALADLLNRDPRVERVGRRLYCAAGSASGGPIRVVDIIRQALASEARPWSHRDLLGYVRRRRDLKSSQIEPYFVRLPDLVRYSAHSVGLAPLSRSVMLQLLQAEAFILDRLIELDQTAGATVEDVWLNGAGDDDRLTAAETSAIIKAALSWRSVRVRPRDSLRFVKEG